MITATKGTVFPAFRLRKIVGESGEAVTRRRGRFLSSEASIP